MGRRASALGQRPRCRAMDGHVRTLAVAQAARSFDTRRARSKLGDMQAEERQRLERPTVDLREAVEMLGSPEARQRLVVEAIARVVHLYTGWTGAEAAPASAFAALEAALPAPPPEKAAKKWTKAVQDAGRRASALAGYDRKTGRFASLEAQAARHVCSALDGALGRYAGHETVILGFVTDALMASGAGVDAVLDTLVWATERARTLGDGLDDGWQAELGALFTRLVPPSGEAPTVQGELVRCEQALSDEAFRNGNVNFGERHQTLVATLRQHLLPAVPLFAPLHQATLQRALDTLQRGGPSLDRAAHREVARFVVRYCRAVGA